MGKKQDLQSCKTGKDFLAYADHNGANIRNGKGSHFVVETDKGSCVVPYHGNQDLGTGLRCKIVKMFVLIGLGIVVYLVILNPSLLGI